MLALAKNITLLDHATDLLEEVIIVNNASTADYSSLETFMIPSSISPFDTFMQQKTLGWRGDVILLCNRARRP